ncbi:MAG: hypothetical protein RL020_2011 [Pseudomonadota bacterium]|jgi:hypothetical protein
MQLFDLIKFFSVRLTLIALVSVMVSSAHAVSNITITADSVRGDGFSLKQAKLNLQQPINGEISFRAQELQAGERTFKLAAFDCAQLLVTQTVVECAAVKMGLDKDSVTASFRADLKNSQVDYRVAPNDKESIAGKLNFSGTDWNTKATLTAGDLKRVAAYLPATAPKITQGLISGTVTVSSSNAGLRIEPDLVLSNIFFSDKDGLHAGEKLSASFKGVISKAENNWRWTGDLDYVSGEALWTPLYFEKGGHKLSLAGSFDDKFLRIESSTLQLVDIGAANITFAWDMSAKKMTDFRMAGKGINLDPLYKLILKPYMEKTAFNAMTVKGNGDIDWVQKNDEIKVFDLTLRDAQFDDANNRFAISGLQLALPWELGEKRDARIRFASAKILNVPLGAVDTPVSMNGYDFSVPRLILPIFDGKLEIKDFQAAEKKGEWTWKFSGGLSPLSLSSLTKSMKLPELKGNISGDIPVVEYANHDIKMGGALVVQLLDGFAIIKDAALYRALGEAPRFTADVDARNLDLALMTEAFSFGKMQGRVDLRINDMELVKWKPVKMDASIMSSEGSYNKKISQQAVQNISSLGGAGAVAAIQRSFLRFFEQFGYEKIGLSCKLNNNICEMGGVKSTPQGYVIVKGGGIPAITVMGYNRTVGWQEFLDRVGRIAKDNASPVIQ